MDNSGNVFLPDSSGINIPPFVQFARSFRLNWYLLPSSKPLAVICLFRITIMHFLMPLIFLHVVHLAEFQNALWIGLYATGFGTPIDDSRVKQLN